MFIVKFRGSLRWNSLTLDPARLPVSACSQLLCKAKLLAAAPAAVPPTHTHLSGRNECRTVSHGFGKPW